MGSILLINAAGRETRVALVEQGHIAEFYLERKKDKGVVGNIYKGRVVRVLPGMQAAFVDIGLDKAAFLYVSDVVYDPDFARAQFELTEGEHEEAADVPELDEGGERPAGDPAPENGHAELQAEVESVEAHVEALHDAVHEVLHGDEAKGLDEQSLEDEVEEILGAAEDSAAAEDRAGRDPSGASEDSTAAESAFGTEPDSAEGASEGTVAASSSTPDLAPAVLEAPTGGEPPAPGAEAAPAPSSAPAERPPQQGQRSARRELRERRGRDRDRDRGRHGQQGRDRREEKPRPRRDARIEDLLKVGQEVVVQISKDPIGSKGARLTSHISIPGRHLVFMPTVDHVGISRRISNEKERRRLREIVDRLRPPGTGFIVRTVAENVPQAKLESDIRFLIEIWNQVVRKNEKRGGPGLMHPDLDLILRATRDLFAADVEKLVVDDREEYERILGFVTAQDPALSDRVVFHDSDEPIFDSYGIEQEIRRATQRKVWLKSGGYLIIDQAEALTAIDVNSGRYVGKKSLEETITKINMEAAKEIVYQLRLRNIGGIIIIDFIDMDKSQNREKVFKALQDALGRDKAKTNVLKISELGLVEMTRKRVRESVTRMMMEPCSYCDGKGHIKSKVTVAYEIFREIRRDASSFQEPTLVVNCHPEVARILQNAERDELRYLMDRFNKTIHVKPQQGYHQEQFDIYGRHERGAENDSRGRRDRGDRGRGERGERGDRGEEVPAPAAEAEKAAKEG